MEFDRLRRNWENLGRRDPMWAILTQPGTEGGRWDEAAFFATGLQFVEWLGAWLVQNNLPVPHGDALDFGCGIGRLTQALAPHFDTVTGVDISQPMIETAAQKNRHGDKVRYVCNPRPDLRTFAAASFDYVQTVIVLQHMRADYALGYLAELLRILRPGGLLFFQAITAARGQGAAPLAGTVEHPDESHMEMHCVPVDRLRAALTAAGGAVLREEEDRWGGPCFESRHFAARRQ